jgi:hypothetical protein
VTILVACLHFFSFQTLLGFTNTCDFKLLHLASKLRLIQEKMSPLEEDPFMELVNDTEAPAELAEEEKDFLKSLEKMAEEIDTEGSSQ